MSTRKGRIVRDCAECSAEGQTTVCTKCGASEVCRTCGELYHEGGDGYNGECPSCADKRAAAKDENGDEEDG